MDTYYVDMAFCLLIFFLPLLEHVIGRKSAELTGGLDWGGVVSTFTQGKHGGSGPPDSSSARQVESALPVAVTVSIVPDRRGHWDELGPGLGALLGCWADEEHPTSAVQNLLHHRDGPDCSKKKKKVPDSTFAFPCFATGTANNWDSLKCGSSRSGTRWEREMGPLDVKAVGLNRAV